MVNAMLLGLACCVVQPVAVAAESRRTAIVDAIASQRDAVVNIHGQKLISSEGDEPKRVNGMGTGAVIDSRGYVVTNYHVVEGVERIEVTLASGATTSATLISHDLRTDLAIIKISPPHQLQVVRIGTSSDLMIGETVLALGNAYGYEHTVTRGIISALHRSVEVSRTQRYDDLIQTDASINPGNSGGPLLNIDGEMIGVNVAVRAGAQGIGFAIPVDKVLEVVSELLSVERLDHTWHGIVARRDLQGARWSPQCIGPALRSRLACVLAIGSSGSAMRWWPASSILSGPCSAVRLASGSTWRLFVPKATSRSSCRWRSCGLMPSPMKNAAGESWACGLRRWRRCGFGSCRTATGEGSRLLRCGLVGLPMSRGFSPETSWWACMSGRRSGQKT